MKVKVLDAVNFKMPKEVNFYGLFKKFSNGHLITWALIGHKDRVYLEDPSLLLFPEDYHNERSIGR